MAECLSLAEVGQVISLKGEIIDRLHMDPLFSWEKSGQSFAVVQRSVLLGIPCT